MKRRLFSVLAAVSLGLFVATVALWVRSHFAWDQISRSTFDRATGNQRGLELRFCQGQVQFSFSVIHAPYWAITLPAQPQWNYSPAGRQINRGWWLWFEHPTRYTYGPAGSNWHDVGAVGCRLLPAAVLFALLPLAWIRFRRAMLPSVGHCRTCGYDLRATPERCPECGTIPEKLDD